MFDESVVGVDVGVPAPGGLVEDLPTSGSADGNADTGAGADVALVSQDR